jgi:hypothetical protein
MVACSACGLYYWPSNQEEHDAVCRPPEIHLNQPEIKIPIFDIAKKHGLEIREVLAIARELGITAAKVASSSLDCRAGRQLEEQIIARKTNQELRKRHYVKS